MRDSKKGLYWRGCAHRLRVTRIALGITEQAAAAAHGVTLATYRRYEAGYPQRDGAVLRFADTFHVSIDWLCLGEAARVGAYLSKGAPGKVAILPVRSARWRSRGATLADLGIAR